MGRTVVTRRDVEQGTPRQSDNFGARLVKYIPAEVVTLYLTLDGVIKAAGKDANGNVAGMSFHAIETVKWVIFLMLLIATPLYLTRIGRVTKRTQVIIATISFAIWVFAVGSGGPFAALFGDDLHQQVREFLSALLLPLYTFGVPFIEAE